MSAAMPGDKRFFWKEKCSAICSLQDDTAPYSIICEIQEVGVLPTDGTNLPSNDYEPHFFFPGCSHTIQNSDLFSINQASTALACGIKQNV